MMALATAAATSELAVVEEDVVAAVARRLAAANAALAVGSGVSHSHSLSNQDRKDYRIDR